MTKLNLKTKIELAGLSFKKEMTTFLILNVGILALGVVVFIFFRHRTVRAYTRGKPPDPRGDIRRSGTDHYTRRRQLRPFRERTCGGSPGNRTVHPGSIGAEGFSFLNQPASETSRVLLPRTLPIRKRRTAIAARIAPETA